jgi:hypothetical protein
MAPRLLPPTSSRQLTLSQILIPYIATQDLATAHILAASSSPRRGRQSVSSSARRSSRTSNSATFCAPTSPPLSRSGRRFGVPGKVTPGDENGYELSSALAVEVLGLRFRPGRRDGCGSLGGSCWRLRAGRRGGGTEVFLVSGSWLVTSEAV